MRATALVLVAAVPSACLPIPEHIHAVPAVHGKLTRGGVPAPDVAIGLVDGRTAADCARPTRATRTDSSGAFVLRGRSRMAPWTPLVLAHTNQKWRLCAGGEVLADVSAYAASGGISAVRLSCELNRLADSTGSALGRAPWNDPRRPGAPCAYVGRR